MYYYYCTILHTVDREAGRQACCKINKMEEQALAMKEGTTKEGDSFSRLEVR